MSEINDLIKKKKEIEEQIKIKKIEEKQNKTKNSNNNSNIQIRVTKEFDKDLEEIIKERVKIRKDTSEISKPRLSELIRNHKKWREIKNDCINFKFEK